MNLAKYVDHTLLKPTASEQDILKLCREAAEYSFAAVCVNPCRVACAADALRDSTVKVCAVTGFPLGAGSTYAKLAETRWCLENGAAEIDTVMNIGEAKAGNWQYVEEELRQIADLVHQHQGLLKVIFENCLLEKEEIYSACQAAVAAGVDYVKTSTGFSSGGATPEDVKLMAEAVAGKCKVKAAGGVKNLADAEKMIESGASRIGTSSGIAIIRGEKVTEAY